MTLEEICERLQSICPYPLSVTFHENRSAYAAARRDSSGHVHLAIHRLFLHSSTPVLEALIRFSLKRDRRAKAVIRQMVHLYFTKIAPPIPNNGRTNACGRYVDLQVIYDQHNVSFFDRKVQVPIAWFEAPHYHYFRHITFGSYDRTVPLIRINRLLDDSSVPLPFVEFIVYHEMLHSVCASEIDGSGRLKVHTSEFRRREALYPQFAMAKEWEKKSLQFFKDSHVRA